MDSPASSSVPTTSAAAIAPPSEANPTIIADSTPCRGCGYDLAGLAMDGACPECNKPVAHSVDGYLLVRSSPEYLRSIHRGLLIVIISSVTSIGVNLVLVAVGVTLFLIGLAQPGRFGLFSGLGDSKLTGALLACTALVTSGLSIWGWYLFSSPEPGVLSTEKGQRARMIVRVSAIIAGIMAVLATGLRLFPGFVPTRVSFNTGVFQPAQVIGAVVGLTTLLASAVLFFSAMTFVRWLAPRIPDVKLANTANTYMWLLPVIYVVGSCLVVGPFVTQVMYLILLEQFRRRIKAILVGLSPAPHAP